MNKPSISVLISSYNYQDYVVEAVQSALSQTYPPLEVIVVDDGSQDESVARLTQAFDKHPKVSVFTQPNSGQMAAWITGCAKANGDVVALLDSDDLWNSNYLEKMAAIYEASPSLDYVYCNMQKFGASEGLVLNRKRHQKSRDQDQRHFMSLFPFWECWFLEQCNGVGFSHSHSLDPNIPLKFRYQ